MTREKHQQQSQEDQQPGETTRANTTVAGRRKRRVSPTWLTRKEPIAPEELAYATPFGKYILMRLYELRMPINQFRRATGLYFDQVDALITGHTRQKQRGLLLSLRQLYTIATLLQVPAEALLARFYGGGKDVEVEARASILLDRFFRLAEEEQHQVLAYLSLLRVQHGGETIPIREEVKEHLARLSLGRMPLPPSPEKTGEEAAEEDMPHYE